MACALSTATTVGVAIAAGCACISILTWRATGNAGVEAERTPDGCANIDVAALLIAPYLAAARTAALNSAVVVLLYIALKVAFCIGVAWPPLVPSCNLLAFGSLCLRRVPAYIRPTLSNARLMYCRPLVVAMSHGSEYATLPVPASMFIALLNSVWLRAANIRISGVLYIYVMSSVNHYNSVACCAPVGCQSWRKAHNICKQYVIKRALHLLQTPLNQCSVVDLACGRGGDLNKLRGCKHYTGIDTAEEALNELARRAREIDMPVLTYHGDATTYVGPPCQLMLCNFAVHYFCDTMEHCTALLDVVAACLVPGGVFCGTYERLRERVAWGTPHHAVVGDCVNALEWRVPWDDLCRIAFSRGLALVFLVPFHLLEQKSDTGIYGFMFQQAQGQCYGSQATGSTILDSRRRQPDAL